MTNYFEPIPYALWSSDKQAFAAALGDSFRETGFAVIQGHPIDAQIIDRNLASAKAFFALPDDSKMRYDARPNGGQRGYIPFGQENAKGVDIPDQKEFWHTGRRLPANSPYRDSMPDTPSVREISDFDRATYAMFTAMDEFGRELLKAIALYLGLEEYWFEDKVENGNSILRMLHYPPQIDAPPAGSVRAAAHGDINVITLLLGAEEAGLQALHRSGDWLDINPPADAIVINCGDMLSRLTGGVLPSTIHRVLNPSPERAKFPRYSTPYFLHFNQDVLIECLPNMGTPEPAITAQEFLMERLREIGLVRENS